MSHERHLIACLHLDPSICDKLADTLHPSDFEDHDLASLYDTLLTLHDGGFPIGDTKLLLPELSRCRVHEEHAAAMWWLELLRDPPLAGNATFYAAEITAAARRRKLEAAATRALEKSGAMEDPADIAAYLDGQLCSLGTHDQHPPQRLGKLIAQVCDELSQPPTKLGRGVMTGVLAFDEVSGGWHAGDLVILAARPGVGKTSLATQVALQVASGGRIAGIVSLEMRGTELTMRMISAWLGIDIRSLRSQDLDNHERQQLKDLADEYRGSKMPLDIWSPPSASIAGIRAYAKKLALQGDLALLVVDYLQLVRPRDYRAPREQQVAESSRALKAIAKELSVPVLCLSQLNRETEKANRRPKLSDLRESGSIEQDADSVVFIHPDGKDHELIIAKQRFGGIGIVKAYFDAAKTTFSDPPVTTYDNYDRSLAPYAQAQGDFR